MADNTQNISSN
jgi:SNF family Na+-dependent transporter